MSSDTLCLSFMHRGSKGRHTPLVTGSMTARAIFSRACTARGARDENTELARSVTADLTVLGEGRRKDTAAKYSVSYLPPSLPLTSGAGRWTVIWWECCWPPAHTL